MKIKYYFNNELISEKEIINEDSDKIIKNILDSQKKQIENKENKEQSCCGSKD